MYYGRSQTNGWNIFARELQNVLRRHNLDLSRLSDRVGIHPEKVRRLVQSLSSPKSFPVLNVEEMDQLIATLNLVENEIIHLRAAALATSVERTLIDRINQDDALQGANQIFPTILRALEEESEDNEGLGNPRGDVGGVDNNGPDSIFASAIEAVDDGDRALRMSYDMSDSKRQKRYAQSAYNAYEEALTQLNLLPRNFQSVQLWKDLQQEAQRGKVAANKRLGNV
jgi:hypothetical protein